MRQPTLKSLLGPGIDFITGFLFAWNQPRCERTAFHCFSEQERDARCVFCRKTRIELALPPPDWTRKT